MLIINFNKCVIFAYITLKLLIFITKLLFDSIHFSDNLIVLPFSYRQILQDLSL